MSNVDKYILYSFDVFDTLITRNTATPKGIFSIMQYHLQHDEQWSSLPEHLKNNFYHLRSNAERFSTPVTDKNSEDTTLEHIYSFFSHISQVTPEIIKNLINFEIETELEYSVGISENISRVQDLLSQNVRIVLISDMYLPSEVIRKLLCKHHPIFQNIPIYVSSEVKLTKRTGNLFTHVKNVENIETKYWVHIGDNAVSDVSVPKKMGISAEHYVYPSLLSYETFAVSKSPENPNVQLSIGVSRNIRLKTAEISKSYSLGCSMGGALLLPYVQWILQDAISKNICRLYFVARDGYVLKEIADIIIKESNYNISTQYIYGSRISWCIPWELTDEYFNLLSLPSVVTTVDEAIKILLCGVNQHDTVSYAKLIDFFPPEYRDVNQHISQKDFKQLISYLLSDKSFNEFYSHYLSEKRHLILKYFQQEIDYSDDRFAFVEFNGRGTTMESVCQIMSDFFPSKVPVYHMFSSADIFPSLEKLIYMPTPITHIQMEIFCRAPHGQTVGYLDEQGTVKPLLDSSEDMAFETCGYSSYVEGVKRYTQEIYSCGKSIRSGLFSLYYLYLEYLKTSIDHDTTEVLGSIPFGEIIMDTSGKTCEYAPRVSFLQLAIDYLRHKKISCTYDYLLSMKRSSYLLRFIAKYVIEGDGMLHSLAIRTRNLLKHL